MLKPKENTLFSKFSLWNKSAISEELTVLNSGIAFNRGSWLPLPYTAIWAWWAPENTVGTWIHSFTPFSVSHHLRASGERTKPACRHGHRLIFSTFSSHLLNVCKEKDIFCIMCKVHAPQLKEAGVCTRIQGTASLCLWAMSWMMDIWLYLLLECVLSSSPPTPVSNSCPSSKAQQTLCGLQAAIKFRQTTRWSCRGPGA